MFHIEYTWLNPAFDRLPYLSSTNKVELGIGKCLLIITNRRWYGMEAVYKVWVQGDQLDTILKQVAVGTIGLVFIISHKMYSRSLTAD